MRIFGLKAENFKRIKLIDIKPKGNVIVVSGKNGQGKSSLLDSFFSALAGKDGNVPMPIREGEKKAEVVVDLGEYVVTKSWTFKGESLKIEANGATFKSPQTLLNSVIGKFTFDPLEFTRMDEKSQKEALLRIVDIDIDLDQWGEAYKTAYSQRTIANAEAATATAQADALRNLDLQGNDISGGEESVTDLVKELQEVQQYNITLRSKRDDVKKAQERVDLIKKQLDDAEKTLKALEEEFNAFDKGEKQTGPLEQRIANVESFNAIVRKAQERLKLLAIEKEKKDIAEQLDQTVENLRKQKSEALLKAKFPVPGLSIGDDDLVMFNGKPLSQASSAEKTRVSMAIAMAANPKLRVIRIMDGSLLDEDSMKIIEQMAVDNDYQIFVEVVSSDKTIGIHIEDGEIVSDNS